tara:strand:- start:727 stop:2250 length:1524 start_codon:yes stop_codon:yes gene_type:complete
MIITSCHNSVLIQALQESIDKKDGLDCKTVADWVRYVGYETDLRSAALSTARAGRELNKIAYQQTGEYDRIGNNFTHWKEHEKYQVFPPNFNPPNLTNMTSTNLYSELNSTFIDTPEEKEINENLLFNTEFLIKCRQVSPDIRGVTNLDKYGTLVEEEIQLVDIRQIHGTEPIKNKKTQQVKPKGFQTRVNEDVDYSHVDKLCVDMQRKGAWLPNNEVPILFLLPEEYRYVNKDGIEVIYGIANGTHRFYAAKRACEERFPAWIADIPISNLYKYACAELNRQRSSSKPIGNDDIVDSLIRSLKDPDTEIHQKVKKIEKDFEDGKIEDKSEIDKLVKTELDDYHLHSQTKEAIFRLFLEKQEFYTPDRKPWDLKNSVPAYILEHRVKWEKQPNKHHFDYLTPEGVRVIVTQDEGNNYAIIARKYIQCLKESLTKPIAIYFCTAKRTKLTKANRDEKRSEFWVNVMRVIKEGGWGYQVIVEKQTAIRPALVCFPELDDEFDETFITMS